MNRVVNVFFFLQMLGDHLILNRRSQETLRLMILRNAR